MCRVKHGEQFVISTKDSNDKELEDMSFENLDKKAEQMEILAKTDDEKIRYVDVYMPVPLLQVYILNTFDNLFIKTKLCFTIMFNTRYLNVQVPLSMKVKPIKLAQYISIMTLIAHGCGTSGFCINIQV